MYIKLKDGAVEKYPYSYAQLKEDNKGTSFPVKMTDESLAEFGVFPVVVASYPQVDYTKNVIEETPSYIDGSWHQNFIVVDATAEEVEERKTTLNIQAEAARAEAYRNESDPLFFKWQRGEVTEQVWLDKVAEIKARYPKV